MIVETAATFAVVAITLNAAHEVADHVFGQNDYMAENKAKPGRKGWSANLLHVFDYHVVMFIMLMLAATFLNLELSVVGVIVGFIISAVTHAFLDRRWPVKRILQLIGSPKFSEMVTPINGMYQADQALHKFILWIVALVIVCL